MYNNEHEYFAAAFDKVDEEIQKYKDLESNLRSTKQRLIDNTVRSIVSFLINKIPQDLRHEIALKVAKEIKDEEY